MKDYWHPLYTRYYRDAGMDVQPRADGYCVTLPGVLLPFEQISYNMTAPFSTLNAFY